VSQAGFARVSFQPDFPFHYMHVSTSVIFPFQSLSTIIFDRKGTYVSDIQRQQKHIRILHNSLMNHRDRRRTSLTALGLEELGDGKGLNVHKARIGVDVVGVVREVHRAHHWRALFPDEEGFEERHCERSVLVVVSDSRERACRLLGRRCESEDVLGGGNGFWGSYCLVHVARPGTPQDYIDAAPGAGRGAITGSVQ
jgi:hypothetical protein